MDESGLSLWAPVSYSYSRIGEQKYLEQTPQRWGSRISILGIMELDKQFDDALAQGGFKRDSYIAVMNGQAEKAAIQLEQTGQITVVVQDNGPYSPVKSVSSAVGTLASPGSLCIPVTKVLFPDESD